MLLNYMFIATAGDHKTCLNVSAASIPKWNGFREKRDQPIITTNYLECLRGRKENFDVAKRN